MPRHPKHDAQIIDADTADKSAEYSASANALAEINGQAQAAAQAMALQVGYDGTLAVGTLEDEIRFYQRRTVEAILETGKRLLVLKELTPHGEFEQRVEALGFSTRTAQRFMQSAAKTSKSATVALLAKQVGSGKAFLELITHDDDTLQSIAEMDDIDKMSASQLRTLARELKGDNEAKDKVLDATQSKLTRLQVQLKKKIVADTDWPDALTPITDQIATAGRALAKAISDLETCRITLMEVAQELDADMRPKYEAALANTADVYEFALAKAERDLAKERLTYDKSLGMYDPASAQ